MSRTMPMPIWVNDTVGPRVMVEATDYAKQDAVARILRNEGYDVLTCGGPEATDDRCPLVGHDECDGVRRADVVVHSMRHHDVRNREVLEKILDRFPTTPVVVEAPRPHVERHPEDFEGCTVVYQPMTSSTLLAAIDTALAGASAAVTDG